MAYRIGIDAGSKTIKVVVLDDDGRILHSIYRRHRADIKTTLAEALHDLSWRHGDISGTVGVTGSAGIGIAEMLGLPFVQEVVATTRAVRESYPQADAIIELGGEDAKIVYLTGGLEQRMNATCAGGTGGFIDTIAFMLGTNAKNMSALALGANRIYPIASRCAVFAQTDVRPLLNAGAKTSDLAASALEAVVRQTLGGLACGRPIKGTVIFLGGPLEHIPELVRRFRNALGISHKEGIKPADAHLFTARGAALLGAEEWGLRNGGANGSGAGASDANAGGAGAGAPSTNASDADAPKANATAATLGTNAGSADADASHAQTGSLPNAADVVSITQLEQLVRNAANPENDLVRLPPLFESEKDYAAFKERHSQSKMQRARLFDCKGPVYLGIDAGSTAVKIAAVNEECQLVYSDYHATKGDALNTTAEMLGDFYAALPHAANREPYAYVAHATVTGYGEDLLRAGLGVDSGVVETLAHVRAARHFQPDLTFLLDIGGQDMKAIWVNNGRVTNAVLNEACSSGCGSFLEGTAYSLRLTPYRFAAEALKASSPVDLGTKCTVFMTSRVRHAQKIGVAAGDIAAGLSYSVVKNALFRIIGANQLHSLGSRVVVQGGAFMSDAVLRAFELVSGIDVIRPDTAHLMGAIGAALTARMRAHKAAGEAAASSRSSLIDAKSLAALNPKRVAVRCSGCGNACALSVVEFESGHRFISGNKCDRAYEHLDEASNVHPKSNAFPKSNACPARPTNSAPGVAHATAPQAQTPQVTPQRAVPEQTVSGKAASKRAVPQEATPQQAAPKKAASKQAAPRRATPQRAASKSKRPPNAVALEQRLLARYGNVESTSARGKARIGYVGALSEYENKPFWHTLLAQLGFSIITPDDERANESGAAREGLESIPSESVCFPAKLSHLRLYDIYRTGAHAAFAPRFKRDEKCPVTSDYAYALNDSAPIARQGACPLVSPLLAWSSPGIIRDTPTDIEMLRESLNEFAQRQGVAPISEDELLCAMDAGLQEQASFKQLMARANERVLEWSKRTGNRAVILGGRPYHMDPAMLHGIDELLVSIGFGVLAQMSLREVFNQTKDIDAIKLSALRKAQQAAAAARANSAALARSAALLREGATSTPDAGGLDGLAAASGIAAIATVAAPTNAPTGDAPWMQGKHFRRLAQLAIDHPQIELVCLQSFGCGYDAVSLMEAREMMEAAGRPFTSLKIDDITDTAHIRIRLRTLAETLEAEQ